MSRRLRAVVRSHPYIVAVLAVAAATALFVLGRPYLDRGQWALLYLLTVALIARAGGAGPALLSAVLCFLAWYYFILPPYHSLRVTASEDWLTLGALLIVGLVVGLQTGRLREREAKAVAHARESDLLVELSTSLVSESSSETMGRTLVSKVSRLLRTARVMLFVGNDGAGCRVLAVSPEDGRPMGPTQLKAAAWVHDAVSPLTLPSEAITGKSDTTSHGIYLPVQTAGRSHGVLAVEPADRETLSEAEIRLLQSVANLAAAFLERQHLLDAAARANALREADELKSTLLSSVSHELKTPLAALTATISNLLEGDTEWQEAAVREELRAIIVDVTRLNHSISSLLDLSRLEARSWKPNKDWNDLEEIVLSSLDALPVHLRGRVQLDLPADLPPICVDFGQVSRVLQNVLENALFYGSDAPVVVGARSRNGAVRVWVEDQGCGVSDGEKELIFEKFYRGAETSVSRPFGTGLGLAIAREIVLEYSGTIRVEDVSPHGARFVVELPIVNGTSGCA